MQQDIKMLTSLWGYDEEINESEGEFIKVLSNGAKKYRRKRTNNKM